MASDSDDPAPTAGSGPGRRPPPGTAVLSNRGDNGQPIPDHDGKRRRRARRRAAIVVLAAGVVVIGAALAGRLVTSSPSMTEGGSAPDFVLENVRPGEPAVSLETLRGAPVVLNLWASWCTPCQKEMPALHSVSERLKDRIQFVGMDNRDFRDSALGLLRRTGVRYPSGFDPKGSVAASYGVIGMPTTVFIAGDGRLLERRNGEISRQQLEETIERLFPDRSPR